MSELVMSVVVLRHGARCLSRNAYSNLREGLVPDASDAIEQWKAGLDDLSATGAEQARAFGKWMTDNYMPERASPAFVRDVSEQPEQAIVWHSSIVPRVVESGRACMQELLAIGRRPCWAPPALAPQPVIDETGADITDESFRPWHTDKPYREWASAWKAGTKLRSWSAKHQSVHTRLRMDALAPASRADSRFEICEDDSDDVGDGSETPAPASSGGAAGVRMRNAYQMTYLHEMLECERYWGPADDDERARRVESRKLAAAAAAIAGARATPHIAIAHLASAALSQRRRSAVFEYARWVWQHRFFAPQSRRLGSYLLAHIVSSLSAGSTPPVGSTGLGAASAVASYSRCRINLYSAHDYTILTLLSALRVPAYPDMGIGFGAFLVFELRRRDTPTGSQLTVDVFLNPEPFPWAHADGTTSSFAVSRPTTFCNRHCHSVITDLPLESLQYMTQSTTSNAAAAGGRGYGATARMSNSLAGTEHARAAASI